MVGKLNWPDISFGPLNLYNYPRSNKVSNFKVGDAVVVVRSAYVGYKGEIVAIHGKDDTYPYSVMLEGVGGGPTDFAASELRYQTLDDQTPEDWDKVTISKEWGWGDYLGSPSTREQSEHVKRGQEGIEVLKDILKKADIPASQRQEAGGHYKQFAIQPYKFCYENKLNNLQSEAISYIVRAPLKNGVEDIKKAIHTLELWIEELENVN